MKKVLGWAIVIVLICLGGWIMAGVFDERKDRSSLVRTFESNRISIVSQQEEDRINGSVKETKIAIMADIHNDLESLKKALELAKTRANEMVIVAGDLSINGNESELIKVKKVLDESGVNYYVVPGNHDLYKGSENFSKVFGVGYGIIKVEGQDSVLSVRKKILLINNGSWKGLGKEQKDWIKKEVEECKVIYCIGVMHMPLNHNFSEHVMGEDSKAVKLEAEELLSLLTESGVREVVTGHLHYATAYTLENLTTIIAGAISQDRNTQTPRFTEIKILENTLEREVVVL